MPCIPQRATGFGTRIVLQEETSGLGWGSIASGQNAYGLFVAGESLRNEIAHSDNRYHVGSRVQKPGYQDGHDPRGEITGELQPSGPWPLLIRHALNTSYSTLGSNPYTHTIYAGDRLPTGLSVEKRFGFRDGTYKWLRYLGSRVDELFIRVPKQGVVTARASVVCREEIEAFADMDATPTYPADNEPFYAMECSGLIDYTGGGTKQSLATVSGVELLIQNNFAGGSRGPAGGQLRMDLLKGVRRVSGAVSAFFTKETWALYQSYKNNATLSLEFSLSRGNGLTQRTVRFVMPSIKLRGVPTPQVADHGPLSLDLPFTAVLDTGGSGTDVVAVITNGDQVLSTG